MTLFERVLRQELNEMMAEDVRIRFVGNLDALPASPAGGKSTHAMNQTKENRGINFTVATNYGGRPRNCAGLSNHCATGASR